MILRTSVLVRNKWSYSPTPLYVFMAYTGTTLHLNDTILLVLRVYDIANFWVGLRMSGAIHLLPYMSSWHTQELPCT
jgi:hypothetical protein